MEHSEPLPVPDDLLTGPFARERREMLQCHLWARDVRNARVLRAMARVPREAFIAPELRAKAYADCPLSIGLGQTISQPYIVARMSELAEVMPGTRALEIGFGSGYQTAVLLELGAEVWGLELEKTLAAAAAERLARLGYARYHLRAGDGHGGWPEAAPFNVILVAAAATELPPRLLEQLAPAGRLVAPVGQGDEQELVRVRSEAGGLTREEICGVRFVPLRSPEQAPWD